MDVNAIRAQFPTLDQMVYEKQLVYLDSGATMQKPLAVIDAMDSFYMHDNASVHRGVHALSARADKMFEEARSKVQKFINAETPEQIIFTSGATHAINLVAYSFGQAFLQAGDEVLISEMEHHANIVPWQMACERHGATLKVAPITDNGELDLEAFESLLSEKTKLVAMTQVSNVLGTINPIKHIIKLAHKRDIPVLVDAAQSIHHVPIDAQDMDCDFMVFSGHKMYGPTGIGVLYGKKRYLEAMPPYQGGGSMVEEVTFEKTTYNKLPAKFEAGTPNIAGVIGLGAAINFIEHVGFDFIQEHEAKLCDHLISKLSKIKGLRIIGMPKERAAVVSFVMEDIHPHDIATILDRQGIAVRAGHHCCMPLMKRFGVPATARATLAVYNTIEDIDKLFEAIKSTKQVFEV